MCMCLSKMCDDCFADSGRNWRPRYYNAGMFLSCGGRYCQVLATARYSGRSHIDFFLVVRYLEKVSVDGNREDRVLHLPFYGFTLEWDLIHFQSMCPDPMFFIDLSSRTGVPTARTPFIALCPWRINYV